MEKLMFLVALLPACSTQAPTTVQLPDGSIGVALDCSGTRSDQSDCMNMAAIQCGGPYEIITAEESVVGAVAVTSTISAPAIRRKMVVKCGS